MVTVCGPSRMASSTTRLNSFFAFFNGQFADMIFPDFIWSGQILGFLPTCDFISKWPNVKWLKNVNGFGLRFF